MQPQKHQRVVMNDCEKDDQAEEKQAREGGCQAIGLCPVCKQGVLDYDGLLNLVCQKCGAMQAGSFT